jgi:cytosine/adenosine deaminase-related metal-dependent hydrolase
MLGVALFSGNQNRVRDVFIAGTIVVEKGRHRGEKDAANAFRGALKRLRAAP